MGLRSANVLALLAGWFVSTCPRKAFHHAGSQWANINFDLSGRRKYPPATLGIPGSGLYQTSLRLNDRREGAQMYDGSQEEGAQREGRGEEMMWLVLRWVAFIIFVGLVIITFVYE
jgi:hypothetical protein